MSLAHIGLLFPVLMLSGAAFAADVDVTQRGRAFDPSTLDIKVGDTVHFHNDDEFIHHVYVKSPDFNFDSDEQPPGETIEIRFTHAGDFDVQCAIHPKMHLLVHVK